MLKEDPAFRRQVVRNNGSSIKDQSGFFPLNLCQDWRRIARSLDVTGVPGNFAGHFIEGIKSAIFRTWKDVDEVPVDDR